jgi:ABC-type Mn2+/Zn2+ transport system permease subunit
MFIVFAIILAGVLVGVSLLLNPLMGIFIVSLIACLAMEWNKMNEHKDTKPKIK